MSVRGEGASSEYGPWNPGIVSPLPDELRRHCTIFLPENVATSLSTALELHDLTGLEPRELVAFRPSRLALHELLIRVTADLSVPDGVRVEDLGRNFREMTRTILTRYIVPRLDGICDSFESVRHELAMLIDFELGIASEGMSAPAKVKRGGLAGIFRRRQGFDSGSGAASRWEMRLPQWNMRVSAGSELQAAAYRALAHVVGAMLRRHGGPWGSPRIVAVIATNVACNEYGSDVVGRVIEPLLLLAVQQEGYRLLPAQQAPVIMNTKGPSASGKSTLRPLQKELASHIGVNWSDFALISPDIWRKQLLDYDSLGAHFKYAGGFTGEELQIVDQKLDRYVARKAAHGKTSHLLIDRFRFDSFGADSDEPGSNLLTRFGQVIFLFFMITPPQSLVERAWMRGLDVGRYKAVDDTLAHGVEAYSGMPELFFTWARRADKHVHFEFLDNSVRRGERPRTVAFGNNDTINVLDITCMLDIERYRKANINATHAQILYLDGASLAAEKNLQFLQQCIDRFRNVNFAEQATGRIYLKIESGCVVWADRELLARTLAGADAAAALASFAKALGEQRNAATERQIFLQSLPASVQVPTLGRWGCSD
jgi:hypothetical protein